MRDNLKVLVACEFSGTVRNAFNERGYDAWSCDLLPDEHGSNKHITDDVLNHLEGWDLIVVAHPPCTRLCNSGVRWLKVPPPGRTLAEMWDELREGAEFFSKIWNAPTKRVVVENPVMHKHAKALIRNFQPAAQTVQPHWFGEPAFKATGLTIRGLAPLARTHHMTPPAKGTEEHKAWSFIHLAPPGPDRWKIRSRTFKSIANAMADQFGPQAMQQEGYLL